MLNLFRLLEKKGKRVCTDNSSDGKIGIIVNGRSFRSEKEVDQYFKQSSENHNRSVAKVHIPDCPVVPASNALSPAERLFLWYIDGKRVQGLKIGHYWSHEYNITDYQHVINKLFQNALLETADTQKALSCFKASELKSLLSDHCLQATGTKEELIERILDTFPESFLQHYCKPHEVFSLTQKGQAVVKKAYHLIYYHKNKNLYYVGLNLDIVDDLRSKSPNVSISTLIRNCSSAMIIRDSLKR